VYEKPLSPVQLPLLVLRVCPSVVVPVILGAAVLIGAILLTLDVGELLILVFPAPEVIPVAVTTAFSTTLTSDC
jgi:hypothetical protein